MKSLSKKAFVFGGVRPTLGYGLSLALLLGPFSGPVWGQNIEIQTGTHLKVRLSKEISTKTARKGEEIEAVLAEDFSMEGRMIIPKGSSVRGFIVRAIRPGRLRGRAELALQFHTVELAPGEVVEISASPVAAGDQPVNPSEEGIVRDKSSGKRTAATIAGTTAAGAGVGAVIDGKRGAAIGAAVGVFAGIIGSMAEGGKDQVLAKGTTLELVLDRPASVPPRVARRY